MGVVKMNEEIRLIAERIRDMREITGFAIEELAQKCGITIQEYMMIKIGKNEIELEEGDSIHFDSSYPHGMKALNGKRAKFLAVVSK